MNKDKQRIKIAEACGWSVNPDAKRIGTLLEHLTAPEIASWIIPDYLNDLNAIHKAETLLNTNQLWEDYKANLLQWMTEPVCATAAQRAEAFLKTLGLWEDEA